MTNSHSSSDFLTERGKERECVCVQVGFMFYMFYLFVVQDYIRELYAKEQDGLHTGIICKRKLLFVCYKPITITGEGR